MRMHATFSRSFKHYADCSREKRSSAFFAFAASLRRPSLWSEAVVWSDSRLIR